MILHGNREADRQNKRGHEKPDKEGKTEIDIEEKSPANNNEPGKINLKDSGLFRRFAQILPNGLAILDSKAEVCTASVLSISVVTDHVCRHYS